MIPSDNAISKWNYPTTIYHGKNSTNLLPEILSNNNLTKPLIITDNNLSNSPIIENLKNILTNHKIEYNLFSRLISDPDREIVYQALDFLQTNNHDSLIIIGGGSALDLGKTVALMANHDYDLWRFEDGCEDYINLDPDLILPTIALPTTAGTGSEVGRVAVIIDNKADKNIASNLNRKIKRKKFIFHSHLIPNWVLLDPVLTQSLPKHLTAATAMDALTHAVEAYCVNSYHPLADGIAIEAIKLINNNILEVYNNPDNLTARGHMLSAATMAATAFQKGLGLIHSLSHPIGAMYKLHHGLLNAVFLPYVLAFNQEEIESKMAVLVNTLELNTFLKTASSFHSSSDASSSGSANTSSRGLTAGSTQNNTSTNIVINWILELRKKLNIPNKLSEIHNHGIDINNQSEIDLIISEALNDPSTPTNPVTANLDNLRELFYQSY